MRKPTKGASKRRTKAASEGIAPLSQTAEYALRAMTRLAQPGDTQALRATEISADTRVPVHYLSKVLRRLVGAGLLVSQKGHGGGFTLARPAAEIRFADVLEAMGEAPATGRCAFGWGNCDSRNPCPLHPAWTVLNDALQAWAGKTTLADVSVRSLLRKRRA
ncbi:MAG: Rrf2 family transcriptional regulator [Polyangiaceae bacterium]